ncbi:hypothetical protein PGT21_015426 [Puccinia graminis f. sp. tritici]|uniref:RRM domain-containing protein n=1 Tax=Puccinia graminis f. sp. tritici TaxID=56615 RepID=A0A5B0RX52_PUCGR|nr:hypothetical protein PGT21_015426 [Puccinia graminis f. sp. tritici]KAA1130546.1 hypothetical protein PGTUg99_020095 [Puccinia graminis f. sp. tritici]
MKEARAQSLEPQNLKNSVRKPLLPGQLVLEFSFISQATIDRLNASNERWNQFLESFRADSERLHQEFERRQRRRYNRNKLFYLIHWEPVYRPPPNRRRPGTSVDDLQTALNVYGEIVHCFLLPSTDASLGAIIHFADHDTAQAAAADLDGTLPSSLFG